MRRDIIIYVRIFRQRVEEKKKLFIIAAALVRFRRYNTYYITRWSANVYLPTYVIHYTVQIKWAREKYTLPITQYT